MVSVNMELIQSNAARMATYGIVIGTPQLTLTLLANIETATKSNYGREFRSAMHAIHKKGAYNHVHDATSLQTILTELAGADGVRTLQERCTCTKCRNSAFSRQFGIIPQLYDAEQRHRLGIHRISLWC